MNTATFALDNAEIWPGDGTSFNGHVVVSGDTITAVTEGPAPADLPRQDLGGMALSPGLVDLMMLGGFGKSILRDDPVDIAREYVKLGVTACQLCIGTLPWDSTMQVALNTRRSMAETAQVNSEDLSAEVLGLYMEGPFMHPDFSGASLGENALEPSAERVQHLLEECADVITMINISPGTPGDAEAVATFTAAGKVVSMAHTNAEAERVERCLEAGTSVLGHVFDNNSGRIGDSGVQQPTIEHVALTDERVKYIHLIGDGVHVHPVMVRLVLRCRGIESLCLVTDAVPRAGLEDGNYVWDDGRLFYKEGGVGRTDKGHLTGSALLLPDMLRNLVKFTGLAPAQAIRAVTTNPAASINQGHRIGLLAAGRRADIVAWDDKLMVQRVWRAGYEVRNVSDMAEVTL